jgi:hypothetical protein
MEYSIYNDDVLWDDYVESQYDSVLEEEMDRLLTITLTRMTDLVGEHRVAAAFGEDIKPSTSIGPAPDSEFINEIVEKLFMEDAFTTNAARAHTYSYLLKTFAMLGTIGRDETVDIVTIENLLNWGDRIRATPNIGSIAPKFDVISQAARSRYDLDMGQGTNFENFVCLLAVARWPINKSLDDDFLDLPRKTVQNLVSAKTIKRSANGHLDHATASSWIASQFAYEYLFPSADVHSARKSTHTRAAIDEPVFVPQLRCEMTSAVEPFLPDFRTQDGFEIINGAETYKTGNYFEALKILASYPRARVKRMSQNSKADFGALVGTFVSIDRNILESLEQDTTVIAGAKRAPVNSFTQSLVDAVAELPGMSVFRKGHSQKMFRFTSSRWGNLAIEPLRSAANIYLLDTKDNRDIFDPYITSTTGPGPTGRNSNLNAIDAFSGHSLLVLKVIDSIQASAILARLSEDCR